jgi:hypothetical protein
MKEEEFTEAIAEQEAQKLNAMEEVMGRDKVEEALDLVNIIIPVMMKYPPSTCRAAINILNSAMNDGFKLLAKMKEEKN